MMHDFAKNGKKKRRIVLNDTAFYGLEGSRTLDLSDANRRSPSNIAFVHTLCTAREEKSTYIRPYRIFCHLNYLSWSQIWSPSR